MDECEHLFIKALGDVVDDLYPGENVIYCFRCGIFTVEETHREDENNGNS